MPKRFSLIIFVLSFSLFNHAHAQDLRSQILKAAYAELLRNFGNEKSDMIKPGGNLASQMDEMLGGPPDELVEMSGNVFFFSACRQHSCDEKGAIIIDMESQKLLAGAWRHFHCQDRPRGVSKCDNEPTISSYYFPEIKKNIKVEADVKEKINAWSESVGARYFHEEFVK